MTLWKSQIKPMKAPVLTKHMMESLMTKVSYWGGDRWKNIEEVEYHEPNKATVDEMVKNNLLDGPCTVCSGYGYILCHCPLDFQGRTISYSRGRSDNIYSVHTAPGGKTIRVPLHYGGNWSQQTSNYLYFGSSKPYMTSKVDLDDLVDHCLLEVEIEIEASL